MDDVPSVATIGPEGRNFAAVFVATFSDALPALQGDRSRRFDGCDHVETLELDAVKQSAPQIWHWQV